jgi:hypothetical protein
MHVLSLPDAIDVVVDEDVQRRVDHELGELEALRRRHHALWCEVEDLEARVSADGGDAETALWMATRLVRFLHGLREEVESGLPAMGGDQPRRASTRWAPAGMTGAADELPGIERSSAPGLRNDGRTLALPSGPPPAALALSVAADPEPIDELQSGLEGVDPATFWPAKPRSFVRRAFWNRRAVLMEVAAVALALCAVAIQLS